MEIIYGTSNKNKVISMTKILKENNVDAKLYTLADIGFDQEIVEDGKTFEENSEIKANEIKMFCNKNNIKDKIIITDDAGLCVDCLNGEPGVYSARYAGEHATQEEILKKLLNAIEKTGDTKRKAKFVCVLTSFLKDGRKIVSKGECNGKIAKTVTKLGGLTYSPVFIPDGYEVPMSELNAEEYEKAHNHRDKAFVELLSQI